jgi:DNA-binding GntR family transcriptional regulator
MQSEGANRTSFEFVRDSLRHAILLGEIPPGTHLVQSEIARQLAVSNTPVREALRDLAAEGLVRLDAYRGALVPHLIQEDLDEIFALLQVLEPVAIRRAVAHIGAEELTRAQQLIDDIDRHPDALDFVSLDREFHGVFASAAQAPRLRSMIQSLRDSAGLFIAASLRGPSDASRIANDDHRRLLEAVRAADIERAVAVEREHLLKARGRWMETLASEVPGGTALTA